MVVPRKKLHTCPLLSCSKTILTQYAFPGPTRAKATWLTHKASPQPEISFRGRKLHRFLGETWYVLTLAISPRYTFTAASSYWWYHDICPCFSVRENLFVVFIRLKIGDAWPFLFPVSHLVWSRKWVFFGFVRRVCFNIAKGFQRVDSVWGLIGQRGYHEENNVPSHGARNPESEQKSLAKWFAQKTSLSSKFYSMW